MVDLGIPLERFVEVAGKGDPSLALWKAAKLGDSRLATMCLDLGADPQFANGAYHGYAPLHIAAQKGHDDVVRLLLARGAAGVTWVDDTANLADPAKINTFRARMRHTATTVTNPDSGEQYVYVFGGESDAGFTRSRPR